MSVTCIVAEERNSVESGTISAVGNVAEMGKVLVSGAKAKVIMRLIMPFI